jgi:lysyl-tRNA synthetase class II
MAMLLADQDTLRDVILFPAMRNLPASGSGTATE